MKKTFFLMSLVFLSSCGSDSGSNQNQETRTEITSQETIEQFTKELNNIRSSSNYIIKYSYANNCVFTDEGMEVDLKSSKYTDDAITFSRETKSTQTSECGDSVKTLDGGKVELYLDASNVNYYCIEKVFKKSENIFEIVRCNSNGSLVFDKLNKSISFKYKAKNYFGDEFSAEEIYKKEEYKTELIKEYLTKVKSFDVYEYNDENKSFERKDQIKTQNIIEELLLDL